MNSRFATACLAAATLTGSILVSAAPATGLPTIDSADAVDTLVDPSPNLYDAAGVGLGEFTAVCDFTGVRANMDPIVAPGSSTFMHSHDFFGNMGVNPNSTPGSLRAQPSTSCIPSEDGSSYWIPTLLENGQALDAQSLTAYYFVKQPMNPAAVTDMPADMRMIAGNARATQAQGLDRIAWTCLGSSNMSSTIPDCGGGTLQLAVFFPQCWDGVNTDSPDHVSHVAYAQPGIGCPTSHPVLIPQLELQFRWQTTAGASWEVSSDSMRGLSDGITAHADFVNGWTLQAQAQRTDDCLRWPVVCLTNGEDRRISQGVPVPPRPADTTPDDEAPTAPPAPTPTTPAPTTAPAPEATTPAPAPTATRDPEATDDTVTSPGTPATAPPAPPAARNAIERIEAEDFDDQRGVRAETTLDTDGGTNIGWLANDDWALYEGVDFGAGVDEIMVRWASATDRRGSLEFRIDSLSGPVIATVNTEPTGGWQSWTTLSASAATSVTGVHDVYLVIRRSQDSADIGNVNWFSFDSNPAGTLALEAESYSAQQGVQTETTSDAGGGRNIGWLTPGDWARWDDIDFDGSGAAVLRMASAVDRGGIVELRLDGVAGELIGSAAMPMTGGWQTWRDVRVDLTRSVSGSHDLYLVIAGAQPGADIGNVNWLRFEPGGNSSGDATASVESVTSRAFWDSQRGIGFSPASLGRYPGQARLDDALDKVVDLGYTMVRTWGADDYTRRILQSIDQRGLDLKVQVGVWITDDSHAQDRLDEAVAAISGLEDHVLGLSLGNEQLADWNSSTLTADDVNAHVEYFRQRSDVPVTYNFSDATLREGSSFWTSGGAQLLAQLDYLNMHNYGATFAGDNRFDPAYSPERQVQLLNADALWLTELLAQLGLSDTPVVLGETGWQSSGYSPLVTNPEHTKAYAEQMAELVYGSDSRYDAMFYFNFSDESWKAGDDHWGLFTEGDDSSVGSAKFDLSTLRALHG